MKLNFNAYVRLGDKDMASVGDWICIHAFIKLLVCDDITIVAYSYCICYRLSSFLVLCWYQDGFIVIIV